MIRKFLGAAFAALLSTSPAASQSVQQSGAVTPNTAAIWSGTGIIKGGVTATDSPLTTFGVTRDAADAICVSSDRSTAAGRNQLCLQAATAGPAKISLQNYGTAAAQNLLFVLNGVSLTLPSGGGTFITGSAPYTAGHAACFMNTAGVIQDCGVGLSAGSQWGIPYYSTTSTLASTAAFTAGQMFVGQTGAAPTPRTLSGDVGAVSAAGAVTLSAVNGVPFSSSYAAHGVLLGQGSSAFVSTTSANTGYCLLSQGLLADPVWAACSSGSGSAGGSDTQVQFNNATSLAGSANLTWVSPALNIGVSGSTTGQLVLKAATNGAVTVQAPTATTAFNFNLPPLAGTSGQPLLSGGGGATAMSFGTLSIGGGGTGQTSAGGTTLDAISGFASTGYINRTGAGTYAFSTVIPVSGGGTGLASGISGGILGYTASGTLASSAALTANALILGGGAGVLPTALASLGTTTTVLHGNAAGAPTFGTVSLTADISGLLPMANGGTNANLTAANGGIFYSTASAAAILTPTATANLPLMSGASTSPTWATVSHPTSATSGGVAYFSSSTIMASSAALTANGVLIGGGAGNPPTATVGGTSGQVLIAQTAAAPTWNTVSGNVTISSSGVTTIGASQVANSMLANAAAYTFKGNATGSSAAPTDFTMASLTQKASPAAGDYVMIADNAASGATKFATVSSIASAGSVSSIAGNTGAFTLNATSGVTNSANDILCSQGSSSQFGCVKVDNSTVLATAGVIRTANPLPAPLINSNGPTNLTNTATYFDGPTVAQGTTGTWFASGTVTVVDNTSIATIYCRLSDGTTTIASGGTVTSAVGAFATISLSGFLASPAGNIRISCRDATTTNGTIIANASGNAKDSTITAYRIQ